MTVSLSNGQSAPTFTLAGANGAPVTLQSYAGRKLVLYFYPKDDTTGCTKEAIAFNGLRSAFGEADTALLGVSPDSVASHEKFKAKYNLEFDLGADESKATAEAYGIWVEKSMYGRQYMGVERSTFLIDREGAIARVWRNVKVPGHADEVLAAAKALG